MTRLQQRDWRVASSEGRLLARSWSDGIGFASAPAPILLFHDSLGCIELWRGFPEKLAHKTGRPVIAYDRLGFGRSDAHPGSLGFNFIADEARHVVPQLRERLGFSRFIVCGHSVGGGMAIETAARFQGDCLAVITMGAQAFVEERTRAGIRRAKDEFARPENLARLGKYHGEKAGWVVDAWIRTWLAPEFSNWSLDAASTRIRCPVLAIHGELDEYGSIEHPKRIAGERGEAVILTGIGHVPYRENEDGVLDLISRFLHRIGETSPAANMG